MTSTAGACMAKERASLKSDGVAFCVDDTGSALALSPWVRV